MAGEIRVGEKIKNPSRSRAWFNLRTSIRYLGKCQTNSSGQISACLEAEAEVVTAIKDFLRTKIPQLSVGSTPLIMAKYIYENINQYSTKKMPCSSWLKKQLPIKLMLKKEKMVTQELLLRKPKNSAELLAS